jgi:small subunit ribosomal protein S1
MVDPNGTEFDPSLYGMTTEYDENGEYKFPEGFDPETNQWLEGYDEARVAWENEYAAAQARWEQHKEQVVKAIEAEANAEDVAPSASNSFSSESSSTGALADDEALAALREKLAGN